MEVPDYFFVVANEDEGVLENHKELDVETRLSWSVVVGALDTHVSTTKSSWVVHTP